MMHGAIPPLPQYASMAWCSLKAEGQLYLYLKILQIDTELADAITASQEQKRISSFYKNI
jgi:hypothetical protein